MERIRLNGILMLYNHNLQPIASNMFEHIHSFKRNSVFPVWEVNTHLGFPEVLRRLEFEVIVLHYSLFAYLPFIEDEFRTYLVGCEGSYKVVFFQDEYCWWPERAEVLKRLKVDCVYTCVEPKHYRHTYWRHTQVPRIETYLPGYVSEEMVRTAAKVSKPDAERSIDVGYRGRQPFFGWSGKAVQEKHEIGVRFREMASGRGLSLDIETEEDKRIYGDHWLAFLANCRAVLGVEAGASIFDVDNEVAPEYERLRKERPELSYQQVYAQLLAQYDGKGVYYRTISPRAFEAAAVQACQILFEGKYSGILEPMVHYFPLQKDFSNFEEVLQWYGNEELRRELAHNSFRDLIASEAYSYRRFIEAFDKGLLEVGLSPGMPDGLRQQVTDWLKEAERQGLENRWELAVQAIHGQDLKPGEPSRHDLRDVKVFLHNWLQAVKSYVANGLKSYPATLQRVRSIRETLRRALQNL